MTTESLLTLSQVAILLGAIVAAGGGFGSWYFSKQLGEAESKQTAEKLESIESAVNSIVTNSSTSSEQKIAEKARELAAISTGSDAVLKSMFPDGYALLDIEGNDWFALPKVSLGSFDWSATRIVAIDNNHVSVMLPSWSVNGKKIFYENVGGIVRKVGATSVPYSISGTEFVLFVLATSDKSLKIAVGVRSKASQQ